MLKQQIGTTLTIRKPDDYHLHLRDGEMLKAVLPYTSRDFGRAIIMPNLVPPVVTSADVESYQARIEAALPDTHQFTPLMTLYLTEDTRADDVVAAHQSGLITAVKLYPAGATTNSASGVKDIDKVIPVLEAMAENGVPLCVHGEVVDADIDIFDREAAFIERVLSPLKDRLPSLKVVMEHVTTTEGINFAIANKDNRIGATVTPHHLLINRNHILVGGIKPHYYCLPVAKREQHRLALCEAVTSGAHENIFLGTDSAPHTDITKENACGCAGVFNAPNTLECLAHVFESYNALDNLEAFTSLNGARFYGLEPNPDTVTLMKRETAQNYTLKISAGDETVTVFDPAIEIYWYVQH